MREVKRRAHTASGAELAPQALLVGSQEQVRDQRGELGAFVPASLLRSGRRGDGVEPLEELGRIMMNPRFKSNSFERFEGKLPSVSP